MLPLTRRDVLRSASCGFGYLALAGLTAKQAAAAVKSAAHHPLAPREPHFEGKAKRVIFLCMRGAPAHVDMFDYKPQTANKEHAGSVFKFDQAGKSGLWISELLPELSKQVDKLCVLNGMHADVPNHPQAFLQMHTGEFRFPRPSLGSWALYGLGSENDNLPGFITINPETRVGGAQNYSSGFLPPIYQGTAIGYVGADIAKAGINNVVGEHLSPAAKRRQLDLIQAMNAEHLASKQTDANLEAAIESLELGFRMQAAVPDLLDLKGETAQTLEAYGVGQTKAVGRCLNDDFGRQCLLARRFAEAGVRYVEICHSNWDQHGNHRKELAANCEAIDRPIAALLADLEARGMLEETLVVWGGEFGRTPLTPSGKENGSNHNSAGFTFWMAGGGIKGGLAYGKTDETGRRAVEDTVNFHDLHATMLHQLGLNHEKLTYRYGGRDFRLTGVEGGRVVKEILA